MLLALLRSRADAPGSLADKHFVGQFLQATVDALQDALRSGDVLGCKMFMRFLGEAGVVGLVSPSALATFATALLQAAAAGPRAVSVLAHYAVGMMLVWCGHILAPGGHTAALLSAVQGTLADPLGAAEGSQATQLAGVGSVLSPLAPSPAAWLSGSDAADALGAARLALLELTHTLTSQAELGWEGEACPPIDRLTPLVEQHLMSTEPGQLPTPLPPLPLPAPSAMQGGVWGAPGDFSVGIIAHNAAPTQGVVIGDDSTTAQTSPPAQLTAAALAGAFLGLPAARFFGVTPSPCVLSTGASILQRLQLAEAARHPAWLLMARDWVVDVLVTHHPLHADAAAAVMTMATPFPITGVAAAVAMECALLPAPRRRFESLYYTSFLLDLIVADVHAQGADDADVAGDETPPSLEAVGMCMRVAYKRLQEGQLGDDVGAAIADWLSHFISCMEFAWFWDEWDAALVAETTPADHPLAPLPLDFAQPHRRFVRASLDRACALLGTYMRGSTIGTVMPPSVRHAVPHPPVAFSSLVHPSMLTDMGARAILPPELRSEGAALAPSALARDVADACTLIFMRLRAKVQDAPMAQWLQHLVTSQPPGSSDTPPAGTQGEEGADAVVAGGDALPTIPARKADAGPEVSRSPLPTDVAERARCVLRLFIMCLGIHGRATLRHAETLTARYAGTLRWLLRGAPAEPVQGGAEVANAQALISHADAAEAGVAAALQGLFGTWCGGGPGEDPGVLAMESGSTHMVSEVLAVWLEAGVLLPSHALAWLARHGASSSIRSLDALPDGSAPPAALHTLQAVAPYDTWACMHDVLGHALAEDAGTVADLWVTCDILADVNRTLQAQAAPAAEAGEQVEGGDSAAVVVGEGGASSQPPPQAGRTEFQGFILEDADAAENKAHAEEEQVVLTQRAAAARYAAVSAVRTVLAAVCDTLQTAASTQVSGEAEKAALVALGSIATARWRELVRTCPGAVWRELACSGPGETGEGILARAKALRAAVPRGAAGGQAGSAVVVGEAVVVADGEGEVAEGGGDGPSEPHLAFNGREEFALRALGWRELTSGVVPEDIAEQVAAAEARARRDVPLPTADTGGAVWGAMQRDAAFAWQAVLFAQPEALTHGRLLRDAGNSLSVPE